jgi:hypothetical protein
LLLVLLLFASSAHAEDWYLSHWGDEPCVALEDVDLQTQSRLYYHGGTLHTPQQLRDALQAQGAQIVEFAKKDDMPPQLDGFRLLGADEIARLIGVSGPDDGRPGHALDRIVILVSDQQACRLFMQQRVGR